MIGGRLARVALLGLTLAAAGCAREAHAERPQPRQKAAKKKAKSKKVKKRWHKGETQTGKATWYGGKWHGKKTASGERFDKHSMTAAHKTIPFNSIVRVTNLNNGRQVVVRINNRGPYGKGRIIDVSRAAAEKLRMVRAGVVPTRIEVLEVGDGKRYKPPRGKRESKPGS